MGETKFNYTVNTGFKHELMFKYLYDNSVENSFAYQRYIALSDASVFNNPVAITKVAAGFVRLHELFVDKNAHIVNYYNQLGSIRTKDELTPHLSSDIHLKTYRIANIFTEHWGAKTKIGHIQKTLFGQFRKSFTVNDEALFGRGDDQKAHLDNCFNAFKDNMEFNILPVFNARKTRNTGVGNIYPSLLLDERTEKFMNIEYQDMMANRDRLGFNILPMYQASTDINKGSHYNNPCLQGWMDRNSLVELPVFNVSSPDRRYSMEMLANLLGYRPTGNLNVYSKTGNAESSDVKHANKLPVITIQREIKELSKSHINTLYIPVELQVPEVKTLNAFENIYGKVAQGRSGSVFDDISIIKDRLSLQSSAAVLLQKIGGKDLQALSQEMVYTMGQEAGYLDLDTFCITGRKYLAIHALNVSVSKGGKKTFATKNESFVGSIPKEIGYTPNTIFFNNKAQDTMYIPNTVFFSNIPKETMYAPNLVFFSDIAKNVFTSDMWQWFQKIERPVNYMPNTTYVDKVKPGLTYIPVDTFIGQYCKDIGTQCSGIFIDKLYDDMTLYPANAFVYKIAKDINIRDDSVFILRDKIDMFIYDTSDFIYKVPKDLHSPKDKESWVTRTEYDMTIRDSYTGTYRKSKDLADIVNDIFATKERYPLYIPDIFIGTYKDKKDVMVFNNGVQLLKQYVIATYDYDADALIKSFHDLSFYDIAPYRGFMIPVSKVRHQAYIDRIDEMAKKIHKNVMITQGVFASTITKPTGGILPDLFCDKEAHQVFIDYKNVFITKGLIHVAIFKDKFVSKMGRETFVYKNEWISKTPKNTWLNYGITDVLKHPKKVNLNQEVEFGKKPFYAIINPEIFVDGDDKICYYNYGYWAEKDKYKMSLYEQDTVHRPQRDMHILDFTTAIKPIKDLYVNQVFHAETIKQSALFQQIEEMHRMYYHCGIRPEDFGNWVWVYETPDPFDKDPYGIDELLLPENDTRYSDFEDIIFDKKKLRPRNPVKKIDETTFIAKYPTKHPIPEYSDIGIDYDASAVKFENYYGIETSIMRTVFLKYYRIWQSKLFEFSTMTMTQSVKLMLDYMYSWIMIYFPPEQIEQALRVFRLIRWFGESAIITNSQYIVSYEFEDLKSKLTTGTCAIPNDIDPDEHGFIANQTMYVDAANGVIRNNPTLIGSADAYVTFTVNIKKNSTFCFSLLNTVGSVNIYIDSVLVDTLSTSQINLIYPLSYTGHPITIKIIKTKINNLNNMFCIGNISIADGAFKDLSIEFDPTLKAGNKPLDEIAKKMIKYANEYDNIQEAYENIRKANLGVSETYKQMVEYWKLHHENKTKGKRLTIKQV